MWRRLVVKNFRSLADVEVDLAPFTLVVGQNGSGKSNLADALVFAGEVTRDAAAAVERRGGIVGVRRWSSTKPYDVTIEVRVASRRVGLDQPSAVHRFTLHSGKGGSWSFAKELVAHEGLHLERSGATATMEDDHGSPMSTPVLVDQSAAHFAGKAFGPLRMVRRVRPNPDLMRAPRVADDRVALSESADNVTVAFRALKEHQRDSVVHTLGRIVPGLREVKVESFDRYLVLRFVQDQKGGVATFSATEMSDGALRALGLLTALAQVSRNQLLVIEEPEVSVHPGAARLLYEAIHQASSSGSVLVTTHSADLLDAAAEDEILVCRYVDGATRVGPLAQAQRQVVRDGLFSLAELVRSEPLRIEGDEVPVVEL